MNNDEEKLYITVTLFPYLMQTCHKERNANAIKRYVIVTRV